MFYGVNSAGPSEATEGPSSRRPSSDLAQVKAEKKSLQKILRKYELQFEQEHGHAPKVTTPQSQAGLS